MGIEPTYPAWKAGVLPLNYTRMTYRGDRIRTCDLLVITHMVLIMHILLAFERGTGNIGIERLGLKSIDEIEFEEHFVLLCLHLPEMLIGKSRFRMASTRTTAAIPTQEAATIEKGIELSEEEATFDDGKTGNASRPAQVPEEKLDETFTSIPPEELGYGDDEPEEDASDTPRASGSSFDEIDDACKTAKNPDATQAEREKAAKVFTDMEGTELYEKMMEGSSEIGIRIKGLIEIRLKKSEKEFVVPDNIEEFDIRNYV